MGNLKNISPLKAYIGAVIAFSVTISLVIFPQHAFEAAVNGLNIWWNIVFPALLPFFIFAEILMGLGVVHFMGVLLEPLMRPLFRVPGEGSFVMAMGLASGFPIGSILTSRLREQNLCTKTEGERLMSFTNTADPLFMFGAVAVGIFGEASLGITIALAHYLSSISVGLIMRFYGPQESTKPQKNNKDILKRALYKLYQARLRDGRPLGQLMGEAIIKSINTLLLIGGFIILFSVIIKIMEVIGVLKLLSIIILKLLGSLGMHPDIAPALINGFFEVTLGCQEAGLTGENVPLMQKIMAAGAIIAWSGLSVHAQVASIISKTDLNLLPFSCARFMHALLAAFYTFLIFKPAEAFWARLSIPVFLYTEPHNTVSFWFDRIVFMGCKALLLILLFLSISIVIYLFSHALIFFLRLKKHSRYR
ncbi:MAG: sporulation integral membrane protein YlbJ [Candidatus Syntrophonatronum acetioxidans]|uniref:Sporulation integral membrane protein YlbJ n=1 Tax=Candidatus Syntrophonatronum acetioxidans TaxID=1795816 RepID=A0A424YHV7_9FIRM|nr:MAG: sporulation integral membrane protein YlbJ [Candidatus Syntrophonatronum acetioxidans]